MIWDPVQYRATVDIDLLARTSNSVQNLSKIIQEINECPYQRVVEMWFNCPSAWHRSVVENAKEIKKPSWAKYDQFPYLQPKFEISSLFLTDTAESDNYTQYRWYIPMR